MLKTCDLTLVEEQVANFNGTFGGRNAFGSSKNRKNIVMYASRHPAGREGRVRRLTDIKSGGAAPPLGAGGSDRALHLSARPTARVLMVVEMKAKQTGTDELQAPHRITCPCTPTHTQP